MKAPFRLELGKHAGHFVRLRMNSLNELIQVALSKWTTSVASWAIAFLMANGALVHVFNILGKGKGPWAEFPMLWRAMDLVLLVFNLVVAVGLTFRQPWSVFVLYIGIILLQIVPYTLFRSHFATQPEDQRALNGLLLTEVLLMVIFGVLIMWQGRGGGL